MRRGNFLSLLLGATIGFEPYEDGRTGVVTGFWVGGGTMASKLNLRVAGGVGGSAWLGGLKGMGGIGGITEGKVVFADEM